MEVGRRKKEDVILAIVSVAKDILIAKAIAILQFYKFLINHTIFCD